MFRYLASWRYFLDKLDRLLALESRAVGGKGQRKGRLTQPGDPQMVG